MRTARAPAPGWGSRAGVTEERCADAASEVLMRVPAGCARGQLPAEERRGTAPMSSPTVAEHVSARGAKRNGNAMWQNTTC